MALSGASSKPGKACQHRIFHSTFSRGALKARCSPANLLRSLNHVLMISRMATRTSIFDKVKLRPAQLRTVADRRFADAAYLRASRQYERANGAMYLAGFTIECLLKAALLDRFPWLQSAGSAHGRPKAEQRLWSLCYRSHNLEELLDHLPDLSHRLEELEARGYPTLQRHLRAICALWTIFARYSPQFATIKDASEMLDRIKELKPWLR